LFNYEWARISPSTWKYNIQKGWEWDEDRFGINFIGHPYSGSYYFNIARSNGYNFWQSFPFAVEGSLLWEYFGENTRPSINGKVKMAARFKMSYFARLPSCVKRYLLLSSVSIILALYCTSKLHPE
jgi:hypothetical protein